MYYLREDDYLTRQQRALAETVRRGRSKRSFQLAEHLAAEGGVNRSDVLAVTAFFLAWRAIRQGDTAAARQYARQLRGLDRGSIDLARQLVRLEAGREQGWLPRVQHDELYSYAWRENRPDLLAKASLIQPRDVPAAGWWADLEQSLSLLPA
ncbi:hypothetical protein [Amycolatopsis benzoatilytica]|uniref:hypothetical protein n=1 Tax=Amycolatopsis benzoatilytica TaxID=346045 RepID=UPI000374B350|nr:hypothetical protein [Amycolatopsis benzoatilytica]